jgi:chitinase
MSNRERAQIIEQEKYAHPLKKWWEMGQRKIAARKELQRRQRMEVAKELKKRQSIVPVFCPNDHSGKPCAGVTNQTVDVDIIWNPLNDTTNSNGTSSDGVFSGGVGVGKLGNGDLASVDGNQIQFYQLIGYGVIVQDGTSSNFTGTNGYTREWDECSNTVRFYFSFPFMNLKLILMGTTAVFV